MKDKELKKKKEVLEDLILDNRWDEVLEALAGYPDNDRVIARRLAFQWFDGRGVPNALDQLENPPKILLRAAVIMGKAKEGGADEALYLAGVHWPEHCQMLGKLMAAALHNISPYVAAAIRDWQTVPRALLEHAIRTRNDAALYWAGFRWPSKAKSFADKIEVGFWRALAKMNWPEEARKSFRRAPDG